MFDKRQFRAALALSGMTMVEVARKIGINPCSLSKKVNGSSEFTRSEIQDIVEILCIEDLVPIFFAPDHK